MRVLLQIEREYDQTVKSTKKHHEKKYATWGMLQTRKIRRRFEKFLDEKYSQ